MILRCERFDPCINNPCSVNSTCLPQELPNGEITYECKCHQGFLGRNCTIKVCLVYNRANRIGEGNNKWFLLYNSSMRRVWLRRAKMEPLV